MSPRPEYVEITCKSAINRVQGMPYLKWSLNPYGGCVHKCRFCFAVQYRVVADQGTQQDFGTRLFIKTNFVEVLARMGASVTISDDAVEVTGGVLHGVDADLADFSDTAPTLAVVAALADSPTRIRGIGFIRSKESDRIGAVVEELQKCGVDAVEEDDGMLIRPSALHAAVVDPHDDHRLAMAFAVLGLRVPGIEIADPTCVSKTFPGYFDVLESLRR